MVILLDEAINCYYNIDATKQVVFHLWVSEFVYLLAKDANNIAT